MADNPISRAWRSMFSARKAPAAQSTAKLGPGGPPVGTIMRGQSARKETHPLVGADVGKVDAALRNAFCGRPAQLMDLYDDMLDRDTRVGPVCRTRALAIQGRPWSVRPAQGQEDNPEAKALAPKAESLIRRIRTSEGGGWRSVLGQASDGPLKGLAVFEKDWAVSPEGWKYPRTLHWRHPNRFVWDDELRLCLSDYGSNFTATPLYETWGHHKFAVHSPSAGRASYPTRRGVMLGMIFPSLTSRYGYKWWLKATEKWGAPIPHMNLPEGESAQASEALDLLRQMKQDWVFTSWGDTEVDIIPGTGSLNPDIFEKLVQRNETTIAIHGLGQNLTTEVTGGSFAAAKVSNLIRLDILAGDLVELDDWVTNQVLDDIVHFNWPGAEGLLEYVTEIEERGDPTLDDVKAGVFAANERRSALGFGPKDDGTGDDYDPMATGGEPPPSPLGGADDPDPFELSRVKRAGSPSTSARSTSGPRASLYSALAGSAPSPSRHS